MRKTVRLAAAVTAVTLIFAVAGCGDSEAPAGPAPDATDSAPEPDPTDEATEPADPSEPDDAQTPGDASSEVTVLDGRVIIGNEFTDIPSLLVGDEIWPTHVPFLAVAEALGNEAIFDGEQGWTVSGAGEFMIAVDGTSALVYEGDLYVDLPTVREVFGTSAFVSAGEIHIGEDME
jgi:hypothetical protein